jgi:hypothetical protein
MTNETRAAATTADMDPQARAQLMRAARGDRSAPAAPVPMGIRYLTPAAPARPTPVDQRPLWMTMASVDVLEEIAETGPRARTRRTTKTAKPAAAAPAPKVSTPTPAETIPAPAAPPAAAKPRATRKPVPAPRAAQPPRPRVLGSYDAFACEACGNRYHQPFTDHGCGPLTPVTVTITTKIEGGRA